MKKAKVFFVSISCSCLFIVFTIALIFAACASSAEKNEAVAAPSVPEWGPHLKPEMVWIPGGTFLMGSNDPLDLDARPVHPVTVDGFFMSKYLVTQVQYIPVVGFNPSYYSGLRTSRYYERAGLPEGLASGDTLPVEQVSWYDAVEFCNKLSVLEGFTPVYGISNRTPAEGYPISGADVTIDWNANGYRLPTEAEWEYAAKGGNGMGPYFIYAGSNDPDAVAWYSKTSTQRLADLDLQAFYYNEQGEPVAGAKSGHNIGIDTTTHPVGEKQPNGLGIYDMSGNVMEWCWDWFEEYPAAAQTNPKGPASGTQRVRRGGTSSYAGESVVRIAYRDFYFPFDRNGLMGFRVVRN